MIQAADFAKALNLTLLSPSTKTEWDIRSADLNRPGMQFCGFYEYFAFERPQVIGKVEMTYLENLDPVARQDMLKTYFSYDLPCVIICRGMTPPSDLLAAARARNIAVYQTSIPTTKLTFTAINYINRCLAPRVTRHGVLVDVYGVGVLLTGESGVGKSEAALELVKRGHQLVADDVVDICRVSDERLTGECPEMVRHFMEIRGIGIIDIKAMYGVGAVALSKSIDLVMHMEKWVEGKEYDRLGLNDEYITILGVKVPHQIMPVRPGRNLAIIIEVAARNLSLKRMGYSAAHELDRRLNEMIMKKPVSWTDNNEGGVLIMVYIGIDIGGTGIQMGVCDAHGKILVKGSIRTRTDIPYQEQIKQMADCVLSTLRKGGYTLDDVASIGAGVPGVADQRTGVVVRCVNLGWTDVPFREEFQKHISKPIYIDNDATVAGLAESVAGVSAGTDSSVFITLGTGVGGGIVIHGKVWNGFHGVGSEIGHMILELDGEPCTCGNRGCLERYCSATAIIRMARDAVRTHKESLILTLCGGDPMRINAKTVFDAAREGDPTAEKIFRRYVHYLAQAIASIINFLDPEVIALGGGVSRAGDFLLDAVREAVPQYLVFKTLPFSRIELARLGPDAGIIGAAMLGI